MGTAGAWTLAALLWVPARAEMKSRSVVPSVPLKAQPLSPGVAALPSLNVSGLNHVVFDVRGSRGGQGDVAAGYLTASDLIERSADSRRLPQLTFVAGPAELKILSRMEGRELFDGDPLLGGKARVVTRESLDRQAPADLYLTMAAAGGRLAPAGKAARAPARLRINQTVFGNTESWIGAPAEARVDSTVFEHRTAGVAPGEAGVYADPVARRLRGLSREQARDFVLAHLPSGGPAGVRDLRAVLEGRALAGADVGLAYGVGPATAGNGLKLKKTTQFKRYLWGLAGQAAAEGKSYVMVTPNNFTKAELSWLDWRLWRRVVFLEPGAPMPAKASRGKVYILRTGILPHPAFVGLLAHSGPVPIVAGDGALSAALALEKPFVMTRVPWNAYNVAAFGQRLAGGASPELRRTIADVYGKIKLEAAQQLAAQSALFAKASRAIPLLTDSLLGVARAGSRLPDPSVPLPRLLFKLNDEVLKLSLTAHRALMGEGAALRRIRTLLRDDGLKRDAAWAVVHAARTQPTLVSPRLLDKFAPTDGPFNTLLARLALWTARWAAPAAWKPAAA